MFFFSAVFLTLAFCFVESFRVMVRRKSVQLQMASKVLVFPTPDALGAQLCKDIIANGKFEIARKGSFSLAVPGGSVLKLLKALKPYKSDVDWSKIYLIYANHKCIPSDDPSATHNKALSIFISKQLSPLYIISPYISSLNWNR